MNEPKEKDMKWSLRVPLAKPWFTEEEAEAAHEVIKSGWVILGPKVAEFEKRFAMAMDAKYAIAVNSGSSALLVSQAALGIKRGDEVISPNMTFVVTATSSMWLGAKPVLADITLTDYGIDPEKIKKHITERTKAVIPVHYAGQSAQMDRIIEIVKENNLFIVEDAAEAHLSEYKGKKVGCFGELGIFSFTPTKPMTTGEGGMIVTNNQELAEKCRLIRNFGDTSKFKWDLLGFNFRMPEVMGAIGLVQLKKLEEAVKIRRSIAKRYTAEFSNFDAIIPPFERTKNDINYQLYTIRLNLEKLSISRDIFINKLLNLGIISRLYYPCLHKHKVFQEYKYNEEEFPNALEFEKTALSLPIYPSMSNEEIEHVIDGVKKIIKMYSR